MKKFCLLLGFVSIGVMLVMSACSLKKEFKSPSTFETQEETTIYTSTNTDIMSTDVSIKPKITIDNGWVFNPIKLVVKKGTEVEIERLNHLDAPIICDYPFNIMLPMSSSIYFTFENPGTYYLWEEGMPSVRVTIVVTD